MKKQEHKYKRKNINQIREAKFIEDNAESGVETPAVPLPGIPGGTGAIDIPDPDTPGGQEGSGESSKDASDDQKSECFSFDISQIKSHTKELSSSIENLRMSLLKENECLSKEVRRQLDSAGKRWNLIVTDASFDPQGAISEVDPCPKSEEDLQNAYIIWSENLLSAAIDEMEAIIESEEICCKIEGSPIAGVIRKKINDRFEIFADHWNAQIDRLDIFEIFTHEEATDAFEPALNKYVSLYNDPDSLLRKFSICEETYEKTVAEFYELLAGFEEDNYIAVVDAFMVGQFDIGDTQDAELTLGILAIEVALSIVSLPLAIAGAVIGGLFGLANPPEGTPNLEKIAEGITQRELRALMQQHQVEEHLRDFIRELLEEAIAADSGANIQYTAIAAQALAEARRLIKPLFEQRRDHIVEQLMNCSEDLQVCAQNLEDTDINVQYSLDNPPSVSEVFNLPGEENPFGNQATASIFTQATASLTPSLTKQPLISLESVDCIGEQCETFPRLRYRVRVIQPGRSLNNYEYSPQMLQRSARLLEGVPVQAYGFGQYQPMFSHLPTDLEPMQPSGFALNRVGILKEPAYESHPQFGEGLFATLIVDKAAEEWAKAILDEATTPGGNGTGVSIFADIDGDYGYDDLTDEMYVRVNAIKNFRSVDLASQPAAGGAIVAAMEDAGWEQRENLEQLKEEIQKLTIEEIIEARRGHHRH